MTPLHWTDLSPAQKADVVRDGCARGLSPRQIGAALKTSRNAVLGVAHRANIQIAARLHHSTERRIPKARPVVRQALSRPAFPILPPVPSSTWDAHLEPVSLLDRRDDQCRWPVGSDADASQMFCGDHVHKRGYCERHWEMRNRQSPAREVKGSVPTRSLVACGVPAEVTLNQALAACIGSGRRSRKASQ